VGSALLLTALPPRYVRENGERRKGVAAVDEWEVEFDRESDGRWIAEIKFIPGALAYGATKRESELRVRAIALEVELEVA
jgi:hypothetical protein